jgi:cytochrome P450
MTKQDPEATGAGGERQELLQKYACFDPLLFANPYPLFSRLRLEEPVCWCETLGCWLITRYDDVVSALRDLRFSSLRVDPLMNQLPAAISQRVTGLRQHLTKLMGASDPPYHTRVRSLVNKAFTPRVVEEMRPRIQGIVNDLIDQVLEADHLDVIRDLAFPVPVIVIADILGLPASDRDQFKRWSDDIVGILGAGRATIERAELAQQSVLEAKRYLFGIVTERRRQPRHDLISTLIAAEEQGEKLTEEELLASIVGLLVGGHETTTNLIGNGTLALLRSPGQLALLRNDPSVIVACVEELLRYDSPVPRAERVAIADIELCGKKIIKGQRVFLMIGSANRDPHQFLEPDSLDIRRHPNRHIAFGAGIHVCVGAPLARAESQIALQTLVQRVPGLALVAQKLEYHQNFAVRGLKSLQIVYGQEGN